jgi:hypothetical protein
MRSNKYVFVHASRFQVRGRVAWSERATEQHPSRRGHSASKTRENALAAALSASDKTRGHGASRLCPPYACCFAFLYLVFAGGGPLSLDALLW